MLKAALSRAKPSAWRFSLQCANLSCLTVASPRGGACGLIRCDAFQSYDSISGGARLSYLQAVMLVANPSMGVLTSHHARALGCSRATLKATNNCIRVAFGLWNSGSWCLESLVMPEPTAALTEGKHRQHESYLWPCTHRPSHSCLSRQ